MVTLGAFGYDFISCWLHLCTVIIAAHDDDNSARPLAEVEEMAVVGVGNEMEGSANVHCQAELPSGCQETGNSMLPACSSTVHGTCCVVGAYVYKTILTAVLPVLPGLVSGLTSDSFFRLSALLNYQLTSSQQ